MAMDNHSYANFFYNGGRFTTVQYLGDKISENPFNQSQVFPDNFPGENGCLFRHNIFYQIVLKIFQCAINQFIMFKKKYISGTVALLI